MWASLYYRVGNELLVNNDVTKTPDGKPKSLSRKYTKAKAKEHEQQYIKKENACILLKKGAAKR